MNEGPNKKETEKPGLGKRISRFFHLDKKNDDDKVTVAPVPASVDVRTVSSSSSLPAPPNDPLPPIPVSPAKVLSAPSSTEAVASPAKYSLHEEVAKSHKTQKKDKKEKKEHRKAKSSTAKEKRHHHHHHQKEKAALLPQATDLVASPARAPAAASAAPAVLVSYSPRSEVTPVASLATADLNARAKNVTDQFADLDLQPQPSEKIQYLLAHDRNAKKAEGIFHRANAGSQVRESQGTNANPKEGLLPGHPLVVNQQRLDWEPESAQEVEKKKMAAQDKKMKPM